MRYLSVLLLVVLANANEFKFIQPISVEEAPAQKMVEKKVSKEKKIKEKKITASLMVKSSLVRKSVLKEENRL